MPRVVPVIIGISVIAALVITMAFVAKFRFHQKVDNEVRDLFNSVKKHKDDIIQKADLAGLPICVQKWLASSRVIGKERIRTVRLKQQGLMRIKEDGPWMQAQAEQYFTADEPGFIWKARVNMNPFLYFAGMDKYQRRQRTYEYKDTFHRC